MISTGCWISGSPPCVPKYPKLWNISFSKFAPHSTIKPSLYNSDIKVRAMHKKKHQPFDNQPSLCKAQNRKFKEKLGRIASKVTNRRLLYNLVYCYIYHHPLLHIHHTFLRTCHSSPFIFTDCSITEVSSSLNRSLCTFYSNNCKKRHKRILKAGPSTNMYEYT